MPHFGNGLWEVPTGRFYDLSQWTDPIPYLSDLQGEATYETQLSTFTAPREGWVRVTCQGLLTPDTNSQENVYTVKFKVTYTNMLGNEQSETTATGLSNAWMEANSQSEDIYTGVRHASNWTIYVPVNASITVSASVTCSTYNSEYDGNNLIRWNTTAEYDR
jgi:hypothetical protein